MAGRGEAGLDGDLGWALGVLYRAFVKAAEAAVDDLPGGPRGYLVIDAAVRELSPNQGALAQRIGIDRTVLTYLLDDLEREGYVERRPDPADRRSRRIVATDKGRTLWERRQEVFRHVERHVLGGLDESEMNDFRATLLRAAAHINEFDPVHNACQVVNELRAREEPPVY
ncbi:MarR family transcriptional regulator [Thermocatellispora tengchongensis]